MTKRAVILGARSLIAEAVVRELAQRGWNLVLAARNCAQLRPLASDIAMRCDLEVAVWEFDALAVDQMATLPERLHKEVGAFELVIQVFGYLGNRESVRARTDEMERTLAVNFVGAAICLEHFAAYLERRGTSGGIIGISSVAGDRGRQSNYLYGASKGALALFLQGLRNRLSRTDIHVLTVKPGFVDTPMTEGMEGLFLVAPPQRVAADIVRAYERGQDVLYTPWFWRWIMLAIKLIPERVFKKLSL